METKNINTNNSKNKTSFNKNKTSFNKRATKSSNFKENETKEETIKPNSFRSRAKRPLDKRPYFKSNKNNKNRFTRKEEGDSRKDNREDSRKNFKSKRAGFSNRKNYEPRKGGYVDRGDKKTRSYPNKEEKVQDHTFKDLPPETRGNSEKQLKTKRKIMNKVNLPTTTEVPDIKIVLECCEIAPLIELVDELLLVASKKGFKSKGPISMPLKNNEVGVRKAPGSFGSETYKKYRIRRYKKIVYFYNKEISSELVEICSSYKYNSIDKRIDIT